MVGIELVGEPSRYEADGQFGHHLRLRVSVSERPDARLNWIEKTDRPYVPGMERDLWTDMFLLDGGEQGSSEVFRPWRDTAGSEAEESMLLEDPPSIRKEPGASRLLELWVLVHDVETGDWALWTGTQTLKCDGEGNIDESGTVFTSNAVKTGNGDAPYPDGFRPC